MWRAFLLREAQLKTAFAGLSCRSSPSEPPGRSRQFCSFPIRLVCSKCCKGTHPLHAYRTSERPLGGRFGVLWRYIDDNFNQKLARDHLAWKPN
jgi:hypothetical protein